MHKTSEIARVIVSHSPSWGRDADSLNMVSFMIWYWNT
jgi:hypothetical protein